jgi:hypothetical protein
LFCSGLFCFELADVNIAYGCNPLVGQALDPRTVIENLGSDLARGLVSLQINDHYISCSVKAEQVNKPTEVSFYLAAYDEQVWAEH